MKRSLLRLFALAIVAPLAASPVGAQDWPARPITLIVPFAPGASADGIARIVGRELSAALGQQVLVDNKPGAGGATGLIAVAKAAPDGYTIGLGATGAIAVNPHLPDAPPLDPDKQLQPLAKLADIPLVLVAGARAGIPNLKVLMEKARAVDMPVGNSGVYTSQHLAAELLASMGKLKLPAIPYRGSAPAVTDVLGGQSPLAMVDLTSAAAHVKSGALVALGVTSASRTNVAPQIPTLAEAGVPGYAATAWMGLFAPKGMAQAQLDRLSREIQTVLSKPEVQAQIVSLSAEPAYLDSKQFAVFIGTESSKWSQLIASIPKPAK